jgi:membrane protease YdiL (CAAX protease family)
MKMRRAHCRGGGTNSDGCFVILCLLAAVLLPLIGVSARRLASEAVAVPHQVAAVSFRAADYARVAGGWVQLPSTQSAQLHCEDVHLGGRFGEIDCVISAQGKDAIRRVERAFLEIREQGSVTILSRSPASISVFGVAGGHLIVPLLLVLPLVLVFWASVARLVPEAARPGSTKFWSRWGFHLSTTAPILLRLLFTKLQGMQANSPNDETAGPLGALQQDSAQLLVVTPNEWIPLAIYLLILGPVFEEILYRAVALRLALNAMHPVAAVFVVSAIFASVHHPQNALAAAQFLVFSVLFCVLWIRYRNIWVCAYSHGVANALIVGPMAF